MQRITVLAAGASGARFSKDLVAGVRTGSVEAPDSVTIIAKTTAAALPAALAPTRPPSP